MEQNTISQGVHGIGIHAKAGNPDIVLTQNRIFDNRNEHIFLSEGDQVRINNNILYGSLHPGQAGILLYNTDQVEIVNNTLDGIPDISVAGIAIGNPGIGVSFDVVIKNNILTRWNKAIQNRDSGNSFKEVGHNLFSENVKDIEDLAANAGSQIPSNRAGDLFVSPGYVDPASRNYHLLAGSPALDQAAPAEAPAVDFDGQARPYGSGFDLGADEASSDAPVSPPSCTGAGCGGGNGNGNPPPPSDPAQSNSGFGCAVIQPRMPGGKFDRSDLGDLLLLSVPLFYALFMRSRVRSFLRRGQGRGHRCRMSR